MKYDILGKKITSVSGGYNGLNLSFDDGVYVIIKAVAHVGLDSEGKLTVNPKIEVTTDKIELKVSEGARDQAEKEEKIPAICPVCGEPVENVFYDGEGKLYADPSHGIIVSEGNQAYHMKPGQDCWGKHTGYPFKEA